MPIPAAFDLSGRVAVVTGAGSPGGIGFAAARMLAELGSAVMISGTTARIQDRASELCSAGFDVAGFAADLTDAAAAPKLVSAALERWGRLDIAVNNAGMISAAVPEFETGTAESMDLATWQAALARNLTTAFLVTKAALPHMTRRGWGRIIMVASVTGPVMAIRADVGYASAKAGMVGLTRAIAVDAARNGITVNAVAPGWIATGSQTPEEHGEGLVTPAGPSSAPHRGKRAPGPAPWHTAETAQATLRPGCVAADPVSAGLPGAGLGACARTVAPGPRRSSHSTTTAGPRPAAGPAQTPGGQLYAGAPDIGSNRDGRL